MTPRTLIVLILLGAGTTGASAVETGWHTMALTGTYARRYVPPGLDQSQPAPVTLWFHGYGGTPEAYEPHLQGPADAAGLVVVALRDTGPMGWDNSDVAPINEALAALGAAMSIDEARVSLSGHSAGGAFSYLIGITDTDRTASRIFAIAAPYYRIDSAPNDPRVRLCYGTLDPNHASSYGPLTANLDALGIVHVDDIVTGAGHNDLPPAALDAAFRFLAEASGGTTTGGTT
nr:hypothetical protein [Planctomycetota bacterium]